MIFQHTWQQILAGDKVQTRRLVQEGDTFDTENGVITAVYRKGRLLYKVGQTRAVQPNRLLISCHYDGYDDYNDGCGNPDCRGDCEICDNKDSWDFELYIDGLLPGGVMVA